MFPNFVVYHGILCPIIMGDLSYPNSTIVGRRKPQLGLVYHEIGKRLVVGYMLTQISVIGYRLKIDPQVMISTGIRGIQYTIKLGNT